MTSQLQTAGEQVHTCQQHLQRLGAFLRQLRRLLESEAPGAPGAPSGSELLRSGLRAECVQCGIRVSGEDLVALLAPTVADDAVDPRILRLIQGYCARKGCDSYYYRLEFRDVPGVNWPRILARADQDFVDELPDDGDSTREARVPFSTPRWLAKAALIVVFVAAALLVRHWRLGGTIPFLREAERFEVDRSGIVEVLPPSAY